MSSTPMLRVRAVGGGALPLVDPETGATLRGRFAGRAKHPTNPMLAPGEPLEQGESLPAIPYYLKAVEQGDLELVADADAQDAV